MNNLILIRHGQSVWNAENKFTGWVDVDISSKGREEAASAAKIIKSKFQGSVSKEMRSPLFDRTHPWMSLYVDLIK